jgi:putative DNA primase/helicase
LPPLAAAQGVYWHINPLPVGLTGKAKAEDVTGRVWVPVDVDPEKPSEYQNDCATEDEKDACCDLAGDIHEELTALGMPAPVVVDSGNGRYLLFRCDLPNDRRSGDVVRDFLRALAARFDGPKGHVGKECSNADRVLRLPGSWNKKGIPSVDRPYRQCRILSVPDAPEIASEELIRNVTAALALPAMPPANDPPSRRPALHGANSPYALAALEGELGRVALAAPGCRNTQLNESAFKLGTLVGAGALPEGLVIDTLTQAARDCGLYDDPNCGERGVEATIRSGLNAGGQKPRAVPDEVPKGAVNGGGRHREREKHQAVQSAQEPVWGEPRPIPNDLPPVAPFDFDLLPETVREHVADVAERMQCPPDFPAAAVMVALGGVLGKKIGIRPKRHDDWLVVPNVWGAVVGRPGIMKTPAIRQPFKNLRRLEIEARERYAKELAEFEEKILVYEAQKKARAKAIADAIKKKQDPIQAAKAFVVEEPKKPTPKRHIVNDSTVEKLGELLNQNPDGLTVFRDELMGLFRQLDKEGQESARAFYLESWDGLGTYVYDRIGRGTIHINSVTLSIMGGIQPGRLLDYLGAALKCGEGDDGLLQRFQLLVYPDVDRKFRNVDRWPDTLAKQRTWATFQRLDQFDAAAVGAKADDGDDGVPFLHFNPEAQGLFDDWRAALEEKVRSGEEHPALESHLAKYRSLVPSLALILHLADDGHGPVTEEATCKAIRWAAYLESQARRIYAIATNAATVAGKALARRVQKGELKDGFTLRDVYRKHWAGLSEKQAVEQAVDLLLELGWLKEVVEDTGGKPKTLYRIHPKLCAKTPPDPSAKSDKSPSATPFGTNGTDHPPRFFKAEGDSGRDTVQKKGPSSSAKSAESPDAVAEPDAPAFEGEL